MNELGDRPDEQPGTETDSGDDGDIQSTPPQWPWQQSQSVEASVYDSPQESADEPAGGFPFGPDGQVMEPGAEDDLGPHPGASDGRGLWVALGFLALLLTAFIGLSAKLWYDRMAAQEALRASTQAISLTASDDLAKPLEPRLAAIQEAVEGGDFDGAAQRLENILRGVSGEGFEADSGGPMRPGGRLPGPDFALPSPVPGPGPRAGAGSRNPGGNAPPEGAPRPGPGGQAPVEQLPPAAMAFFRQHQDVAKVFGQANMLAVQLRDRGGDVTKLRELRGQIIQAAAHDDLEGAIDLLKKFDAEFKAQAGKLGGDMPMKGPQMGRGPGGARGPGGPRPGQPPAAFMTLARQCGEALRDAQLEGKDVRKAMALMRQSEQRAMRGDFRTATKLGSQALKAIKEAPKLPARPQMFENPIVHMLLGLMQVEDGELSGALDAMRKAYGAAKGKTVASLSAAMQRGIDVLKNVGKRRGEVGKRLNEMQGGAAPTANPQERQRAAEARIEKMRGGLGEVIDRIRAMPAEEFAKDREALVEAILDVVFPERKKPQTPATPATGPQASAPTPEPTAEDRVRQKLLTAAEPYLKVKADSGQKELAEQLGDLFTRARQHLAKRDYAAAEALADKGLALLGIGPAQPAGGASPVTGEGHERPGFKLNLQGYQDAAPSAPTP